MVDIYFYVFSYYKVKLALESESKTDLDEACQTLIESLPKGKIYSYFFEFGNLMHVICLNLKEYAMQKWIYCKPLSILISQNHRFYLFVMK
jgi:hypothetical protein